MARPLTWSFGGGTQSVAIAVLVAQRRLPKPECVVIADTGYEAAETWEYLNAHVRPLLEPVGVEVEVVGRELASTDGLYALNGDLLIPAFTGTGKLPTYCSNEWKKRVVQRFLRSKGYGPKNPVRCWLGISVDELHRAKPSGVPWQAYHWPLLLDTPMRRDECRALVTAAGLPEPPRSSCWLCPHRNNVEWARLRDQFPADWAKAIAAEAAMRELDDDVYLHRQTVPLADADLDGAQPDLFGECDSGFCFT